MYWSSTIQHFCLSRKKVKIDISSFRRECVCGLDGVLCGTEVPLQYYNWVLSHQRRMVLTRSIGSTVWSGFWLSVLITLNISCACQIPKSHLLFEGGWVGVRRSRRNWLSVVETAEIVWCQCCLIIVVSNLLLASSAWYCPLCLAMKGIYRSCGSNLDFVTFEALYPHPYWLSGSWTATPDTQNTPDLHFSWKYGHFAICSCRRISRDANTTGALGNFGTIDIYFNSPPKMA